MLTERTRIGHIGITEGGALQIRMDRIIEDNGQEIARKYHRLVVEPGDSIPFEVGQQLRSVFQLSAVEWNPQAVADYKRKREATPNA